MSACDFVRYFRELSTTALRPCHLLVPALAGEEVIGVWGGVPVGHETASIILFNATCTLPDSPETRWIHVTGIGLSVDVAELTDRCDIVNGQPLASVPASSLPNIDEEWDDVVPPGLDEWLRTADQVDRDEVMAAIREYDRFYRSNPSTRQTERDVYAVTGGWGVYVYENEWRDHPGSKNVAFTYAEAEPYYSIRRNGDGRILCMPIIT